MVTGLLGRAADPGAKDQKGRNALEVAKKFTTQGLDQSHLQTLIIHKLCFDQNYYIFNENRSSLLIKIVLCSKLS